MDLSGVIFVVLALVWAAYLLPKALRHHDEAARTRSVDEVSEQARVVVTAPPARPGRVRRLRRRRSARAAVRPAAAAARRRRRILAVLLLGLVGAGVAAGLGVVPTWVPVIPGALLVGFLVLCRVVVRRDRARRLAAWRASAVTVSEPAPVAADESASGAPAEPATAPGQSVGQPVGQPVTETSPQPEPVGMAPTADVAVASVGSLDDTAAFRELVGVPVQRDEASTASRPAPAGTLWDPLPVTLPTYVGKQRAMRSVRTISLGDPGVSSSGRDAADSALVAGAQAGPGTQSGDDAPRVVGG